MVFSRQFTVNNFQSAIIRQNQTESKSLEYANFRHIVTDQILKGLLVAWKGCWLPGEAVCKRSTAHVLPRLKSTHLRQTPEVEIDVAAARTCLQPF